VPTDGEPSRLHVFNGGLLRPGRVRRILTLAGLRPVAGLPGPGDLVGVWGQSPYAARGEAIALRRGAALMRIEDAFLRSIRPGRMGEGPLGLLIDRSGVHFDGSRPSDLETLLATHPLDSPGLLGRARDAIARLRASDLSKYNLHDPGLAAPAPGYVLVVDQVLADASVRAGGGSATTFRAMLARALADHPEARIVIRTHPEAALGLRAGAYGAAQAGARITLLSTPVSPWALLAGAAAVYTHSSQLGFEAILAGHRPQVFGQPFYAGWGMSQDHAPLPRRGRRLRPEQLFAAAMILAPVWHDPCRDRLCSLEEALDQLEAEVRAFRQDRNGHVAVGMRLWKRPRLQSFFGGKRRVQFAGDPARAATMAQAQGRTVIAWAGRAPDPFPLPVTRIEDGFLRSQGLGADLVPPLSLVADDLGIYYDPTRESRLERLIAGPVPPGGRARAERLVARLTAAGLSKDNTRGALPPLPPGHRILVPGQVEDDASIRLGAGEVRTNLALLRAARQANPDAVILYKLHPDVEAGLRAGAVPPEALAGLADVVLTRADPALALAAVQEVWTMTSLLGFEALIRGLPVTCLGAPFYAGWGLTRDLGPMPARRTARPTLADLAHAALIAYPRYHDPVSGRPCPPEVAADRLAEGPLPASPANRLLARAQGLLASRAGLWR
jgi:capsular polysaccharide export protein